MQKMLVSIDNFLSNKEIELFISKQLDVDIIVQKTKKYISEYYKKDIYVKWVEFLTMKPGSNNDQHVDIDGDEEKLISAIIYLNEQYSGGEFVFMDTVVKPKAGQLIFFKSTKLTPHSVTCVEKNDRLSISMFFDLNVVDHKYKYLIKTITNKYKRDKRPI